MPKAPPRKPPWAAGDSYWKVVGRFAWKGARQALVIGAILGFSQLAGYLRDRGSGDSAEAAKNAPAVVVLGDGNFSQAIASHPEGIVVNFHSAGCKFCTKLAPHYEAAAKELRKGGPVLASLDSEAGAAVLEKLKVDRYPTVLWLWRGERAAELSRASEKSAAEIVKWAKWLLSPAVQDLDSRAEFNDALPDLRGSLHESRHLFVAFNRTDFPGLRDAMETAAQRNRQRNVFLFIAEAASDGTLLKAYGPDEARDLDYNGTGNTPEEVLAWVTGVVESAVVAELKSKVEAKKKQLEELQAEAALKREEAAQGNNTSNSTDEPPAAANEPPAAGPPAGSQEL